MRDAIDSEHRTTEAVGTAAGVGSGRDVHFGEIMEVRTKEPFRIGMRVPANDGDVGGVEDILTTRDGVPFFVVVRHDGVFERDMVLPVTQARAEGDFLRLSLTKARVDGGEPYDETKHGERTGLFSVSAGQYDQQDP